jgi:L,D-transpeptidase ErfK/SrfK
MQTIRQAALGFTMALMLFAAGCAVEPNGNTNANAPGSPSPLASPSPSPATGVGQSAPVTLPVLDALFADEAFKTQLKAKVAITDEQLAQVQKIAAEEVTRLRDANIEGENEAEQSRQGEESRARAAEAMRGVIGEQKANDLFAFARDYWVKGAEGSDTAGTKPGDVSPNGVSAGPNAVPKDTRIVVNIPAFRMDVFREGSLVKSYKIGIGYPEFPLPTGLRKAQSIIFNPTWTPPDEPWVAKMKRVSAGQRVEAGSKLNPLGPIKIPIGLPSLIHGGKSPAKLGTFASHGCVGLTTPQIQDFAKLLAQVGGSDISDAAIKAYFTDRTKTKVVKLDHTVPVELRYETIVVEDGKLHIYRDVYDQGTNTEANLRAVLTANGVNLEDLGEEDQAQALEALAAMSPHPQKAMASRATVSPPAEANAKATGKKVAAAHAKKPVGKNQKEVVIELAALNGKGYPAPVNLDTGNGKPPAVTVAKAGR